jgi:formate hydrogenlyase subunit 3/multisubunit Na+/H+ antiporter MnhD subunit
MPKLIRLYIDSVLVGFALAIGFVLLLVLLDIAQIGRLVLMGRDGLLAAGMMTVFFGGLFASVQFALRVVTQDQHGKGRRR